MGGVVGIDLAGDEYNFNNSQNNVEGCFQYAKQELLLNTTVHAGESYTDMSRTWHDIRSAVEVRSAGLEALGRGHGSHLRPRARIGAAPGGRLA